MSLMALRNIFFCFVFTSNLQISNRKCKYIVEIILIVVVGFIWFFFVVYKLKLHANEKKKSSRRDYILWERHHNHHHHRAVSRRGTKHTKKEQNEQKQKLLLIEGFVLKFIYFVVAEFNYYKVAGVFFFCWDIVWGSGLGD